MDHRERNRKRAQRDRDELSDSYVKKLLFPHGSALRLADLPPGLIDTKRAQLRLLRLLAKRLKAEARSPGAAKRGGDSE